jgi:hypothetical protein
VNVLYLSPHFPANQYLYCAGLSDRGVRVLGVADIPAGQLAPEARSALAECYQVGDLEDYAAVRAAAEWFIARYGPLDRIESHAEHWMRTEARLRREFGVQGRLPEDLDRIQRKSAMKARFLEYGIPAAPGLLVADAGQARAFAAKAGFPLVAKPDIGVGAVGTRRLDSAQDLEDFLAGRGQQEYFLEPFLQGRIQTFDGLAGVDGRILFAGSFEYSCGVMEAVNLDQDLYYFTRREMEADLEALGRRALEAFAVRDSFFHFEFFRLPDGRCLALEANLRPPGAWSVDMYNYAGDIDLFALWAGAVTGRERAIVRPPGFTCCYAGRKDNLRYRLGHEEILRRYGPLLVHHTPVPRVFRGGMGDYAYIFRTSELAEMKAVAESIQEKA